MYLGHGKLTMPTDVRKAINPAEVILNVDQEAPRRRLVGLKAQRRQHLTDVEPSEHDPPINYTYHPGTIEP